MEHEFIIFAVFAGLQVAFHNAHKLGKFQLCKHVSQYHWIVWLIHPTVVEGLHEYLVHIVVYSGVVLGH